MRIPVLASLCLGFALANSATAADCQGIEFVTYRADGVDSSCHLDSELFLPWVDGGIRFQAPRERSTASVTTFEAKEIEALGAFNIQELMRITPSLDLPEY